MRMNDDRIIHAIMNRGRRSCAASIYAQALTEIKRRQPESNPRGLIFEAVVSRTPFFEVVLRTIGGAHYHVPKPIAPRRARRLALYALVYAARARRGPMWRALADEVVAAPDDDGPGTAGVGALLPPDVPPRMALVS